MSFDQLEASLTQGTPIRLYRFNRGLLVWLYTSAAIDVTHEQGLYKSVAGGIEDDGIRKTPDPKANAMTLQAPADINVAQLFRGVPPTDPIGLQVYDMHYGEPEAVLAWVGSISGVSWPSLDRCKIRCASRDADGDTPGLVDTYNRGCQAMLGDHRCKVNLNTYRVDLIIQSMDGSGFMSGEAEGYDDDWFTGGYVEWSIGSGQYERRHIESHVGSSITILGGTAGMPDSGVLRTYPGCDFLATTCKHKFDNLANMRAVPQLQGSSPFDGNPVW